MVDFYEINVTSVGKFTNLIDPYWDTKCNDWIRIIKWLLLAETWSLKKGPLEKEKHLQTTHFVGFNVKLQGFYSKIP